VSLLLRSEIRVRLGSRHCSAELWRAGWSVAPVARVVIDDDAEPLLRALDALSEQRGALSGQVHLSLEDEWVYFMMLPGEGSASQVRSQAVSMFESSLGAGDWRVEVSLAPCGTRWAAFAIQDELLLDWQARLSGRELDLVSVRPALLSDLSGLRRAVAIDRGVLALVRSEGMTLVMLDREGVNDLQWQRCDASNSAEVMHRVDEALSLMASQDDGATVRPLPNASLVPLHAHQHQACAAMANGRGWQVTPALINPVV
jgi:hypothetical protein